MKTKQSQKKTPSTVAEALALGYENQDSDTKVSADEMCATGIANFRHPENAGPDLHVPFVCTYSYGRPQLHISSRKKEQIMKGSVDVVIP